jgi:hypothetical protein
VVWPNEPFWAPEKRPKIFSISVSNTSRDVRLFVHTHIHSIHTDSVCVFSLLSIKINYAYSQYTDKFSPHSVKTQQNSVRGFTSFCLLSVYVQFISHILSIQTDLFHTFSVDVQILLTYMNGECTQIILNTGMELFLHSF